MVIFRNKLKHTEQEEVAVVYKVLEAGLNLKCQAKIQEEDIRGGGGGNPGPYLSIHIRFKQFCEKYAYRGGFPSGGGGPVCFPAAIFLLLANALCSDKCCLKNI